MPVNTGLITGHKIITPAVGMEASVGDIETALGVSSGDLGTLCQSRRINKWAKYKPISYPSLIETTGQLNANLTWKSDATWWKGSNGTCGFEIVTSPRVWGASTADTSKSASTLESEANSLAQWFANAWNYAFGPKGGTSSPFRQIDFNYYDHNAVPFVKDITEPSRSTFYAGSDSDSMKWTLTLPSGNEGDYSLGFGDINAANTALSSYHLGLIFVNAGSRFPDYTNRLNRKYVIVNSATLASSSGKSITVTGAQTAALVNENNIASEQDFKVYPIFVTSGPTSMSVFGTVSFGSMVAIPNSRVFNLSLVPNELEGFLQGGGLEEVYSPVSVTDYTNNNTYISIVNRSTKSVSVNSINLSMQIWKKSGSTYRIDSTVTSGYTFPGTTFPFTIAAGASISIPVNWTIGSSSFQTYQDYLLREIGNIRYTKSGSSSASTATLLANPAYEPNGTTVPMLFQGHISVDTITSSSFYVNIWVENISGIRQSFSWGSVVYDITSYPKTISGTDYNDGLVQTGVSISGSSETIASGGTSSVKRIQITPRTGTYGYFASVTVRGNTGYNVGSATATANY